MTKFIRNLLIFIFPFLLMIIVNEIVRTTIKEKPYSKYATTAINSADKIPEKCSWICHNRTAYCKKHHVKYLKNYYSHTDAIYFEIIDLMTNTGNYGLANIILLVILFPLFIWYFIIKSVNIQDKINKLNKKQ